MSFNRILFVSTGLRNDDGALVSAMNLATKSNTNLDIVLLLPLLPKNLIDYAQKFADTFITEFNSFAQEHKVKTSFAGELTVLTLNNKHACVSLIQMVLQHKYDLLIKQVDSDNHEKGFKALDMDLLRKCPCPLMLCRPDHDVASGSVAVAIDPMSDEHSGHALSLNLLSTAIGLTSGSDKALDVISCWDFSLESSLTTGTWLNLSMDELASEKEKCRSEHLSALNEVLNEVPEQESLNVQHLNGFAHIQIPEYVAKQEIDLLVMGTVARTGIAGFIIGNTAENVLQSLQCSLLALKPAGFVSPVKLD
jgi:nucleotide-binding universal stress UspA family protein